MYIMRAFFWQALRILCRSISNKPVAGSAALEEALVSRRSWGVWCCPAAHCPCGQHCGLAGFARALLMGLELLTPVPPATRWDLSRKCFPTLQTVVVLLSGNGSTDQMFHGVIENSILSESVCCQKVLSVLQQRGWLDPPGPELASLRLDALFCDSGSYSSLGFARTGTFFFKSPCPLPVIVFVQFWFVFFVWMCTST